MLEPLFLQMVNCGSDMHLYCKEVLAQLELRGFNPVRGEVGVFVPGFTEYGVTLYISTDGEYMIYKLIGWIQNVEYFVMVEKFADQRLTQFELVCDKLKFLLLEGKRKRFLRSLRSIRAINS